MEPCIAIRVHCEHAGHVTVMVSACLQMEFATAFHRLCGKKVLFPQGFHCTGMPIKVPKLVPPPPRQPPFCTMCSSHTCPYVTLISLPCLSASQYVAALAVILQIGNCVGVVQQGSGLQEVIMFSQPELVMLQACADKLEREIQLYCDPDKPGSLPVFPDEEPGAAVSETLGSPALPGKKTLRLSASMTGAS